METMATDDNMRSWMSELVGCSSKERQNLYAHVAQQLASPVERFEWAKHAALLNVRDAIHSVIDAYQNGDGVEPSEAIAFEWIRKAAQKNGDAEFYFELAMAYHDGDGTERNPEAFWEWMTKSASTGVREAMYQLAEAHLKPEFGQFSVEKSIEWTRKMADAESAGAMVRLARSYRDSNDLEKALDWAQRAVKAASEQWEAAQKDRRRGLYGELTIEDRPEAFSMLAGMYRLVGRHDEAAKTSRDAATFALESVELAREQGEQCGKKLPEIMAEGLARFKTKNGDVKSNRKRQYLEWLLKIGTAIDEAYIAGGALPKVLSDVLYSIARAYKEGIGGAKNFVGYRRYLKKCAEAGDGNAAYEYAELCQRTKDPSELSYALEMAVAANNMRGLIARALGKCDLPPALFASTLRVLESLWSTVDTIRREKHVLTQDDCREGLVHYTDAIALSSMLAGGRSEKKNFVRLYSTAYVNDPKEGTRLQTYSRSIPDDPLKGLFPDTGGAYLPISWEAKEFHVFIGCFSMEADKLDLWRFYGRDGQGFGVVTPFSAFNDSSAAGMIRGPWTKEAALAPRLTLYKVLYKDSEARDALDMLRGPLRQLKRKTLELEKHDAALKDEVGRIAALVISELLYLYKHEDYASEREVRAIEARALGDPKLQRQGNGPFAKLFVETPAFLFHEKGSQIIVGPKVESPLMAMIDIRDKLAGHGWEACEVKPSTVSYR
jgi:TPR repeat protein